MRSNVVQRTRVTYGIAGALCYASVLDMGRLWERLLRRARVPLTYTQGFSPHPRMQFAAALPVGYGSVCEVLDFLLAEPMTPEAFVQAIARQAPQGLSVLCAENVPIEAPALQAAMRAAHYRVHLCLQEEAQLLDQAVERLLARPTILRERLRKGRVVEYDLRPLIQSIALRAAEDGGHVLEMVLRCGPEGSGRPEEVVAELGLHTSGMTVQRTRLIWVDGEENSL